MYTNVALTRLVRHLCTVNATFVYIGLIDKIIGKIAQSYTPNFGAGASCALEHSLVSQKERAGDTPIILAGNSHP